MPNTSHITEQMVRWLALALLLGVHPSAYGQNGVPRKNEAHSPSLCVVPGSLDFGKVGLHIPSAPASIAITNCGKIKIVIDNISTTNSQQFSHTDSCPHQPLALAPGAACAVAVRFFPDGEGLRQGDLLINSEKDKDKDKVTIHLSGTGVATKTTLSTTHIVFLPQLVGTQSKPGYVTIRNSDTEHALRIDSVTIEGNFVLVPGILPCAVPGDLRASGPCTLAVSFTPHTSGSLEGRLIINDSDPASPHVIALNGISTGIDIAPTQLVWDRNVVGAAAETKEFTVHAVGEQALQIENIKTHGDFEQHNSCGKELHAGTSCTVTVTFRPTESGKRVGSVSITDSDPTRAQSVFLIGWGGVASLLPSALVFEPQAMGTTSPPQTVTLKNYGNTPLTISSINVNGDFAVPAKTCGESLQAGQSCTLNVSFSPTHSGAATGFVAVDESGDKTPVKVTVTGTAAESAPQPGSPR
ncbi:MAG TPA: choice-of-anchor D domain-containing protein [Candidatus Eremiobacteraceae bacterium]|nr:choice-of-anchor D domain-containing protein [Candidatus Eremiobacteraceae bacterium]